MKIHYTISALDNIFMQKITYQNIYCRFGLAGKEYTTDKCTVRFKTELEFIDVEVREN